MDGSYGGYRSIFGRVGCNGSVCHWLLNKLQLEIEDPNQSVVGVVMPRSYTPITQQQWHVPRQPRAN